MPVFREYCIGFLSYSLFLNWKHAPEMHTYTTTMLNAIIILKPISNHLEPKEVINIVFSISTYQPLESRRWQEWQNAFCCCVSLIILSYSYVVDPSADKSLALLVVLRWSDAVDGVFILTRQVFVARLWKCEFCFEDSHFEWIWKRDKTLWCIVSDTRKVSAWGSNESIRIYSQLSS